MTKQERERIEELLYASAYTLHRSSLPYSHLTHAFMRGFKWGVEVAMDRLGYTCVERWDIAERAEQDDAPEPTDGLAPAG